MGLQFFPQIGQPKTLSPSSFLFPQMRKGWGKKMPANNVIQLKKVDASIEKLHDCAMNIQQICQVSQKLGAISWTK